MDIKYCVCGQDFAAYADTRNVWTYCVEPGTDPVETCPNCGRALRKEDMRDEKPERETPDPYDYSVLTATERLDIVRKAWQEYDLKEMANEYCDAGTAIMLDLAITAKPAPPVANDTVTVTDAYNNQLWETGTLLVHNYGRTFQVIDIAAKNSDGMYHLKGRANMCYVWGSDTLDYTPHAAGTQAVPRAVKLTGQQRNILDHAVMYGSARHMANHPAIDEMIGLGVITGEKIGSGSMIKIAPTELGRRISQIESAPIDEQLAAAQAERDALKAALKTLTWDADLIGIPDDAPIGWRDAGGVFRQLRKEIFRGLTMADLRDARKAL
jgi:hypothetical protein